MLKCPRRDLSPRPLPYQGKFLYTKAIGMTDVNWYILLSINYLVR